MRLKLKITLFFILSILSNAYMANAQSTPGKQIVTFTNKTSTNVLTNMHFVTYSELPLWIKIACISSALLSVLVLLKLLPFLFLRLRRIRDNPTRNVIYDSIKSNPGQTLTEISRDTMVNRGTLWYHLRILLKNNMILLMKKGKSFYVFNHVQSMDDEDIWLYMKNQTEKEILYSLMDKPGATNSELSIMLHLDKSTIHKYLKKYSQKGIIQFKMDDRHKRAYLTGKANETLKRYRPDGIVESTVDS